MKCDLCDIKVKDENLLIHNTFGTHCRPCWNQIVNSMNVDEWAKFMRREFPDNPKAWND